MTKRRLIALSAVAGLILTLAACGGGGGGSKKTPSSKTPTARTPAVTGTLTPKATGAANQTPGAATTPSSQGGGGDSAPQATPNAVGPTRISGQQTEYRAQFTIASDPSNLQPLVESDNRLASRLRVIIGTGAISIDGDQPFITVTGTIDANGAFSATGTGRIDPYRNVEATFQGTISNGQLTGTYAIGTNGALPGSQPITYNVTATARSTGGGTPAQ